MGNDRKVVAMCIVVMVSVLFIFGENVQAGQPRNGSYITIINLCENDDCGRLWDPRHGQGGGRSGGCSHTGGTPGAPDEEYESWSRWTNKVPDDGDGDGLKCSSSSIGAIVPWSIWGHYTDNWHCPWYLISGYNDVEQSSTDTNRPPGESREPIVLINGHMVHDGKDLYIPCPGISLGFSRSYNSGVDYSNVLGAKWVHSYEWNISEIQLDDIYTNGSVILSHMVIDAGDGREYKLYNYEGTNKMWTTKTDSDWVARETANGEYELFTADALVRLFDTNGVLQEISDPYGNILELTYTNNYPSNLLVKVEHNNGQYLNLLYQGSNLLEKVETPNTNFYMSYSYNSDGELTAATRTISSGDYVKTYAYDAFTNHSMTQIVNYAGDVYAYSYATNASGETASICTNMVMPENGYYQHSVTLDKSNNCSQEIYTRGSTNLIYDHFYNLTNQRISRSEGPCSTNLVTTYSYDPNVSVVTNTRIEDLSLGEYIETSTMYDDRQKITERSTGYCSAPGNVWKYEWDALYSKEFVTNAIYSFVWNPSYRDTLRFVTDPEGGKVEFEYINGLVSKLKLHYDSSSNSYDTSYAYTTNGLLSAVTNANGHWVKYYYDTYGFPTSVVPQAGPTTIFDYNQLGHLEKIILPGDSGTRTNSIVSDELGRVASISLPNGQSVTFLYDALGNLTNHIDTAGRTNKYTYLPTKKLASITRVLEGATNQDITISFDYDQQFNTLIIKDAKDRAVESYVLDDQDRATTITNVENQTMSVNYGVAKYVNSITRFDGSVVSNDYDSDGRLSAVEYLDSTNTFTYLKNNLLKTAINEEGIVSNAYNFANRLTSSAGVMTSGTVSYAYASAGQVTNVTSVAGNLSYTYDNAERLKQIDSPDGVFTNAYNANNGLLASVSCTNSGVDVSYGYDVLNRVTSIVWEDSSDTVLKSFAYEYDNAGMITNATREGGSYIEYTYDSLDRLTGEKKVNSSDETTYEATYTYDEVGNRLTKVIGDTTVAYTLPYGTNGNRMTGWVASSTNDYATLKSIDVTGYLNEAIGTNPALGQLYVSNLVSQTPDVETSNFWANGFVPDLGTQNIEAAIGDVAGNVDYATNSVVINVVTGATYGYNAAGCITNIIYSGINGFSKILDINWNQQYQVTSVFTNGVLAESYQYDAHYRRVSVSDGVTTNWIVWNGWHVIAEVDNSGELLVSYSHGAGMDNILAMTDHATTNTFYYVKDVQGTIHALIGENGTIVESYKYDAWGRVTVYDANGIEISRSAYGNRYLFHGRYYSWDTGLYYYRSRMYNAWVGRWLSKDMIGISGGLNQYVFCVNSPVNYVDPSGQAIVENETGAPVTVSGNPGAGDGSGAQVFGVIPDGQTGGGEDNPVTGYATRDLAEFAADPNNYLVRPPVHGGMISDVDYYDDPCPKKKHSPTRGDNKVIGDDKGPKIELTKNKEGEIVPDAYNTTLPGAYIRELGRKVKSKLP